MGMIFDQQLASANAPCTRMIAGFGTAACAADARARMAMDKKYFIVPPCRSVGASKIGPGVLRARLDEGIGPMLRLLTNSRDVADVAMPCRLIRAVHSGRACACLDRACRP